MDAPESLRETPTTWIDVEDLFDYFVLNPRPSGIQRLALAIMREAAPVARFVRRGTGGSLREVAWAEVEALFDMKARAPAAKPVRHPPGGLRAWVGRLPAQRRAPLLRAITLQRSTLRLVRVLRTRPAPAPYAAAPLRRGDRYLVLGAPWAVPGFAAFLAHLRAQHDLVVSLLLYDLVPVRHPEWCTREAVALFNDWLTATLPLCDRLMAISRHTAADVEAFAREAGIKLAGPVEPIPIGSGLPTPVPHPRPPGLPRAGQYVLFVSTLEARKNHALLFRVWQRLVDEVRLGQRAPGSVPDLVFAGRVGWLVSDLIEQLNGAAWLGGRVRLVRDPTDEELRALYDGCLFTVLPSLHEGWGLPLTESLAAGKPCLAANATALPEAGGALCRYFDPLDIGSAHRAVTALIDTPGAIARWEEEVRRGFRPTPWRTTAEAVMGMAAPVRDAA